MYVCSEFLTEMKSHYIQYVIIFRVVSLGHFLQYFMTTMTLFCRIEIFAICRAALKSEMNHFIVLTNVLVSIQYKVFYNITELLLKLTTSRNAAIHLF